MKTLGLLGGMSWESTTSYYQHLNRLARDRLGGQHSARLVMWSADFAPLSELLASGDWGEIASILTLAARRLEAAGAEAVMICSNTMHRVAPQIEAALKAPLLHVADATAEALKRAGVTRPLLLATRFTMEQPFYLERLSKGGVTAVIPEDSDRARLHAIIFDELVQGRFEPCSREAVGAIVRDAVSDRDVDGVILGCTEFALLVGSDDFTVPLFDTTEIHARAAMDIALSS